jgi:hypothetical protein
MHVEEDQLSNPSQEDEVKVAIRVLKAKVEEIFSSRAIKVKDAETQTDDAYATMLYIV